MRTLSATTLANQAKLNREPVSQIVLRDMMLRWSNLTAAAEATGWPDALDGDGIPQCPIDMDVSGDHIYRAWCASSTVLRVHDCNGPETAANWQTSSSTLTTDGSHRPSVFGNNIFYAYAGSIYKSVGGAAGTVFRASAYTGETACVALAAVSSTVVYMARLHIYGRFKYLSFHRITASGVTDCPHTIVVDSAYDESSLTWFDAATIGDRDVLIVGERATGSPVTIFYESGVWSQPRPLLPQDIVDNYTFLRVAAVSVIADFRGESVLWATGRQGFGGSTGANAQEYDCVLRSKDGEHWTADRYSYLCSTSMRGKLLTHGGYCYHPGGSTVKQARQTYVMNNDHAELKHTIAADLLEWTFDQPQAGTACKGAASIADHDGQFSLAAFDDTAKRFETAFDDLAIHPGMWLWRYAGYDAADSLVSTEIVDAVNQRYMAGDRALQLTGRDSVMRLMRDWRASQDWQWLSQQKHYDECHALRYLYAIGTPPVTVYDRLDNDRTGDVDQTDVLEQDDLLKFQAYNQPGIYLTTKPYEARNFLVKGRFQFGHEGSSTDAGGLPGNIEALDTEQGTLSYITNGLQDTGQDFSAWAAGFATCGHSSGQCAFGATHQCLMERIIIVLNDDETYAWGYIGPASGGNTQITVYPSYRATSPGWGTGSETTDKTPLKYAILSRHARLGYGFGVVGCVDDEYNLVAAFLCVKAHKLFLLARLGDEDNAFWFPLASLDLSAHASKLVKGDMIEVRLIRDGRLLTAEAMHFDSGSSPTRTSLGTISYNWGLPFRMVDGDDDRCKVGVICHLSVPETHVERVLTTTNHFARQAGMWQITLYSCVKVDDNYADFSESSTPLHIGDEELEIELRTASNWKARYHMLDYKTQDAPSHQIFISSSPNDDDCDWDDDGSDYRWILAVTDGGGLGASGMVMQSDTASGEWEGQALFELGLPYANPWKDGAFYIPLEEFDSMLSEDEMLGQIPSGATWQDMGISYFHILPGFYVKNRGGSKRGSSGTAQSYPLGALVRQHFDDYVYIRNVWAYDGEFDKTLEWVLEDIAYKAGVMDFVVYESVDTEMTPGLESASATEAARWLQDTHDNWLYTRDFDITAELPQNPSDGDALILVARANSRLTARMDSGQLPLDFAAIKLTYGLSGSTPYVSLHQTGTEGANEADWILVDQIDLDSSCVGTRVRFVGRENHFTVYVDDNWAVTFHAGPIYEYNTDGYSSLIEGAGYIGVCRLGSTAVWTNTPFTQPELWAWTDGKIVDQRMDAASGIQRVVEDRRIKYQATQDGKLKITTFADRDDLGAIGDHIYHDEYNPTDGIPTHVRAVGAEIAEYIDHDAAGLYGLAFEVANVPSLDEPEAYQEAQRIIHEAVSAAEARNEEVAAQLDWETEDKINVNFEPTDGGATIDDDYIVDTAHFSYKPGNLVMTATIRKLEE